jgi:hypothetical protein
LGRIVLSIFSLLTAFCAAAAAAAAVQARGFAQARSRGNLQSYTFAVAKAISEADDKDAVKEVGPSVWVLLFILVFKTIFGPNIVVPNT